MVVVVDEAVGMSKIVGGDDDDGVGKGLVVQDKMIGRYIPNEGSDATNCSFHYRQRLPQSENPCDIVATNRTRIECARQGKLRKTSTVSRRAASLRNSYDSHHESKQASQGSGSGAAPWT